MGVACGGRRLAAWRWVSPQMSCALCVFFFFQAEDGIRDLTVTGVQTCALPISCSCATPYSSKYLAIYCAAVRVSPSPESWGWLFFLRAVVAEGEGASSCPEIGRASCRERV